MLIAIFAILSCLNPFIARALVEEFPISAVSVPVPDPFSPLIFVQDQAKWIWEKLKDFDELMSKKRENLLFRAASIAYKNALRTFLSRIAYDTATRLAEGGIGKSPLFNIKSMGSFVEDVGKTTLADTMDILAKDNGFFEFDVCSPQNLDLKFAIHYSLFGNFNGRGPRGGPRCTLSQIAKSWTEWASNVGRTYSSANMLDTLRESFTPEQSDIGIYLTLDESIASKIQVDKINAQLERVANQGFLDVTKKISGKIKTPSKLVSEQAKKELVENAPVSETTLTGDIIADSIGIFTNTLASKLLRQLFEKGLGGDAYELRSIAAYNWANEQVKRTGANSQFATLASITPASGFERIIDALSQCPDPKNPGPMDCVINQQLVGALEQGLTVKDAIIKGNLNGNALVGYKSGGNLDYNSGFPYRSLVIMRINRLIPSSWELAALFNIQTRTEKTLQQIINCYNASNDDPACHAEEFNYNVYYHLIDPNWVLKAPESFCARKGSGYQIISSSLECTEDNVQMTKDLSTNELVEGPACEVNLINRDQPVLAVSRADDYCADRKSCLSDDGSGSCTGGYGYCAREESFWRFQGDSCDTVYSSCETFNVAGKSQTVLRDTLEPCDSSDAGCKWYATTAVRNVINGEQQITWRPEEKIYLNGTAKSCSATDSGCTNLSRLTQGVNLAFNGDFELSDDSGVYPEGWDISDSCGSELINGGITGNALKLQSNNRGNCVFSNSGYIPVDSRYSYSLGWAVKADSEKNIRIVIGFLAGNNQQLGSYSTTTIAGIDWKFFKGLLPGLPAATQKIRVIVNAINDRAGITWFDNLQLAVTDSYILRHNNPAYSFNPENYQKDYSQNVSFAKQNLKVAPDYLGCDGYNITLPNVNNKELCLNGGHYWRADILRCVESGDDSCINYAAYCSAEEVGCQGYTPQNGDPEVSARTAKGDLCPAECAGFESYLESKTYFDYIADPESAAEYQNFLPSTASKCSASSAGCEEFTNLDEVQKGGEGKEYFTYLRQCISQTNPNLAFYYTWEGSDTTGYQLKKWELLKSDWNNFNNENGIGPCTNIAVGTENCRDNQLSPAACSADELADNPDCRDFFNEAGNHYLRLQSRTVTASGECHPYRRSLTGEVYNADPAEGVSCSASVNNCREYKGNQGNNVRNIFSFNFEDGSLGGWTNSRLNTIGLYVSNEAIQQGGHSLRASIVDKTIILGAEGNVFSGKQYELSFWAKKSAEQSSSFKGGSDRADAPIISFTQTGLTNNWQLYKLGPVELTNAQVAGDPVIILRFANLEDDEVVYLDNIIIKEFASSFYAIKNSWNTPASCNDPYPNAQLGCGVYKDRQNQTYYLKSFDYLCGSEAVACEAYVNTQNSTRVQALEAYHNGDITVPNDGLVYLVNDTSKQCGASSQGCTALGSPLENMRIDPNEDKNNDGLPDSVSGFETVYLKANPDDYGGILCGTDGLYCENFKGELTSGSYYNFAGEAGDKLCELKNNVWVIAGTNDACPGASGANIIKASEEGYNGWVGQCPSAQSMCTQFTEVGGEEKNYYYIDNDSLDKSSCTEEDKNGDCIKFLDHSLNNEAIIKVRRDRQCKEWLECQTGFETETSLGNSEFACLSLVRCHFADDGVYKVCVKQEQGADNDIYDLTDRSQTDLLAGLSGYSHPGASWSSKITAPGYVSPEAMSQVGQKIDIINGGFETYLAGDLTMPEGWKNAGPANDDIDRNYSNGNCSAYLDNLSSNVHSGHYALKISLDKIGEQRHCPYRSTGTGGYFPVDPNQNYVLTFYARSQNGAQIARVGFAWFNSEGGLCDGEDGHGYCNGGNAIAGQEGSSGATLTRVQPTADGWQKYTFMVGPNGFRPIPLQAKFFRLYISAHSTYDNRDNYPGGAIWFDDFAIEPSLTLNGQSSLLSSKECRLYPKSDSPACDYSDIQIHEGWKGYCLEPDPFYQPNPLTPTNWDKCLQWYPVDSLQGDRLSVFKIADIGYKDRAPLYYCAQSKGVYNQDNINGFYGYVINKDGYEGYVGDGTEKLLYRTPEGMGFINKYDIASLELKQSTGGDPWPNIMLYADQFLNLRIGDKVSIGEYFNDTYYIERLIESHGFFINDDDFDLSDDPYLRDNDDNTNNFNDNVEDYIKDYEVWRLFPDAPMDGCNGHDHGHLEFKLFFNGDGNLAYYLFRGEDCAGEDEWVNYDITWNLREVCELIAQTAQLSGGKVQEKSWLKRFNGWFDETNTLGYSKNLTESPYGSFLPPRNSTPENWSLFGENNIKDAPLYVYNGGSFDFGPSAGVPWSVGYSRDIGRMCTASEDKTKIGSSCLISSDCGSGGVCSGIGSYCYNNDTNIMTGKVCNQPSDCASGYTCRVPQNLYTTPSSAISRLQNLFAKIYGVWKWNSGSGKYELCDDNNCSRWLTYTEDISETAGRNISINNLTLEYVLTAPGGKAELTFNLDADDNQLPIDGVWINWGDGSSDYFRGPLNDRPVGTTQPYRAYHVYSCTTNANGQCATCTGGVQPSGGSCVYQAIEVDAKDHWGFCFDGYAGDSACPAGSGGFQGGRVTINPSASKYRWK